MFALFFLGRMLEPGDRHPPLRRSLLRLALRRLLRGAPARSRTRSRSAPRGRSSASSAPPSSSPASRGMDALASSIGLILLLNLAITFGIPRNQHRRPPRRPRRRRPLRARHRRRRAGPAGQQPPRRPSWRSMVAIGFFSIAPCRSPEPFSGPVTGRRRTSAKPMLPGGSTRSGWRRWPSSSTPSTSRGPGREKVEAASTAKTRPAPSAWIRSQCSIACARASSTYQPQGIAITTSGLSPESAPHCDLGRLQARRAGDVLAAGDRDHLRDPVAADVGGVEPLQRDHPGQARPRDGSAHAWPAGPPARRAARGPPPRARSPRRGGSRPRASRPACSGPAGRPGAGSAVGPPPRARPRRRRRRRRRPPG